MEKITLSNITKENGIFKGKMFLGMIEELFYDGYIAYKITDDENAIKFIDKNSNGIVTSRVSVDEKKKDIYLKQIVEGSTILNNVIKFKMDNNIIIKKEEDLGYVINCDKLYISENPELLRAIIEFREQNKTTEKIISFEVSIA